MAARLIYSVTEGIRPVPLMLVFATMFGVMCGAHGRCIANHASTIVRAIMRNCTTLLRLAYLKTRKPHRQTAARHSLDASAASRRYRINKDAGPTKVCMSQRGDKLITKRGAGCHISHRDVQYRVYECLLGLSWRRFHRSPWLNVALQCSHTVVAVTKEIPTLRSKSCEPTLLP
jgi:hypothetical protein